MMEAARGVSMGSLKPHVVPAAVRQCFRFYSIQNAANQYMASVGMFREAFVL